MIIIIIIIISNNNNNNNNSVEELEMSIEKEFSMQKNLVNI